MNRQEYAVDRAVDPEQLDVEAAQQSDLYGKWAERAAMAKADVDQLEWEVELLEAQLQGDVRNDPSAFGIDGDATEAAVKAAVKRHPKYVEAVTKHHQARRESYLLTAAEKAMAQKKNMIEELVKLFGQQYFAGPNIPRNIESVWQAHRQARTEIVGNALRSHVRRRVRVEGQ